MNWTKLKQGAIYIPMNRWSGPSKSLELKRMPFLRRVRTNPELTNRYLEGTPGFDRMLQHGWGIILALQFLNAGGLIQVCPPETTTKPRMGRPPINGVAMTAAERKRRSRQQSKTLPPQERHEPGAVVPMPLGPAVPGDYQLMEIEHMITLLERDLAGEYHERLGELLDRLADAPPDQILTREEFTIVAAAAVLSRRLRSPAEFN
jgi:hypothetical protein